MAIPLDIQTYKTFYLSLPKGEKEKLERHKNVCLEYHGSLNKQKILTNLETEKKHDEIVRICAKIFADPTIKTKTGYEFFFAEPLIELGEQNAGNHSFDLLIFSENENRAIFIECKSSIKKAQDILKEIQKSKELVLQKIKYLSKQIGHKLNPNNIEYVLCMPGMELEKIEQSINNQKDRKNSKYNVDGLIIWIFNPYTKEIRIYDKHNHHNQALSNFLESGINESELKRRFDLPLFYNTNPMRVITNLIVAQCYRENVFDDNCSEPKVIPIINIEEALYSMISLGINPEEKRKYVEKKIDAVIKFGIRYNILEKINDNSIRLNCRGTKIETVKDNLTEKYTDYKIDAATEEKCEKDAMKKYREHIFEITKQKTLLNYDS